MKKNNQRQENVDSTKREFMKKFGGYAATAPVGMYMLMTPSSSAACTSGHHHKHFHKHFHKHP